MRDQWETIAEFVVMLAEKLREIVQEKHERLQDAFVVDLKRGRVLSRTDERSNETKGIDEQQCVHVLCLTREATAREKKSREQRSMSDDLQPGEREAGRSLRPQQM